MRFWLINHFFKRITRSPKISGGQIWLFVGGAFFAFGLLYFIASHAYLEAQRYTDDPVETAVLILGFLWLADLAARFATSKGSFAEEAYFTLPINKSSLTWQTLLLAHFNFISLVTVLFCAICWSDLEISGVILNHYLLWTIVAILTNNLLVILLKKNRNSLLVLAFGLVTFAFAINEPLSVIGGLMVNYPLAILLVWFVVLALTSTVIYTTYSRESYGIKAKRKIGPPHFTLKIKNPVLRQEVLLLVRNKRPRGLILTYFLMPPYLLFMLRSADLSSEPFSMAAFFIVYFFIAGLSAQYAYFGLAWEGDQFDGLMLRANFKQMLESKHKLLTVMAFIGALCTLVLLFYNLTYVYMIMAVTLFQLGVGSIIFLYLMRYNDRRININKTSFFNYQGVQGVQIFGSLLVLGTPNLLYFLLKYLTNPLIAIILIGVIGLTGLLLRNQLMDSLHSAWNKKRYHLISSYRKT